MALTLDTGLEPVWYSLRNDPDTQFYLQPLTGKNKLNVTGKNATGLIGDTMLLAVQLSVLDFKGINRNGKDVPFSTAELQYLPAAVIIELTMKINELSGLTDEERKN